MAFVFKIGGTNYAHYLLQDGGLKVKRTQVDDDEASGRDRAQYMHRALLSRERTLTCRCRPLTQTESNALAAALDHETVTVQYSDPQSGTRTSTFYGTEFEAATMMVKGSTNYWRDGTFTLVEAVPG